MAWAQAHTQGAPTERVLALVERFIGMEQVAPIAPATVGRPAAFSTAELLRHERVALQLAAHGRHARVPTVSPATVEQVARERGSMLGREQLAMVHAVASSPERVVCVVGHAGAGKTTALAALADAYQRDGHVAIGAAPSGVAAANLAAETGIPSGTLHRLLGEAREHGGLPRRCCSSSTRRGWPTRRTLTRVLLQIERAEGKAVLVGDPAQLPAVGPGGLFAAIVERKGAIELHENHRQHDELERRALALLRDGRSRDYLAHAAKQGRLPSPTPAPKRRHSSSPTGGRPRRGSRRQRDDRLPARRRRRAQRGRPHAPRPQGQLGHDRLRLENGTELAVGERILCTRNDRRLEVANGSRGTVVDVDRERRAIEVELDDTRRLTLPRPLPRRRPRRHAYALTGHKTQGLTVERAFVLADDRRALKEWGYVALSRAANRRASTRSRSELEPDAPPHRLEPEGPVDRLADALTRPAAETLALDAATTGPPLSERAAARTPRPAGSESHDSRSRRNAWRQRDSFTRRNATLAGLGVLGRARHGRALRDEIGERESDSRISTGSSNGSTASSA